MKGKCIAFACFGKKSRLHEDIDETLEPVYWENFSDITYRQFRINQLKKRFITQVLNLSSVANENLLESNLLLLCELGYLSLSFVNKLPKLTPLQISVLNDNDIFNNLRKKQHWLPGPLPKNIFAHIEDVLLVQEGKSSALVNKHAGQDLTKNLKRVEGLGNLSNLQKMNILDNLDNSRENLLIDELESGSDERISSDNDSESEEPKSIEVQWLLDIWMKKERVRKWIAYTLLSLLAISSSILSLLAIFYKNLNSSQRTQMWISIIVQSGFLFIMQPLSKYLPYYYKRLKIYFKADDIRMLQPDLSDVHDKVNIDFNEVQKYVNNESAAENGRQFFELLISNNILPNQDSLLKSMLQRLSVPQIKNLMQPSVQQLLIKEKKPLKLHSLLAQDEVLTQNQLGMLSNQGIKSIVNKTFPRVHLTIEELLKASKDKKAYELVASYRLKTSIRIGSILILFGTILSLPLYIPDSIAQKKKIKPLLDHLPRWYAGIVPFLALLFLGIIKLLQVFLKCTYKSTTRKVVPKPIMLKEGLICVPRANAPECLQLSTEGPLLPEIIVFKDRSNAVTSTAKVSKNNISSLLNNHDAAQNPFLVETASDHLHEQEHDKQVLLPDSLKEGNNKTSKKSKKVEQCQISEVVYERMRGVLS